MPPTCLRAFFAQSSRHLLQVCQCVALFLESVQCSRGIKRIWLSFGCPATPVQVIIAGAGGAAHLPGMVAALTPLPVIGVPVKPAGAHLDGLDALLSIVQVWQHSVAALSARMSGACEHMPSVSFLSSNGKKGKAIMQGFPGHKNLTRFMSYSPPTRVQDFLPSSVDVALAGPDA